MHLLLLGLCKLIECITTQKLGEPIANKLVVNAAAVVFAMVVTWALVQVVVLGIESEDAVVVWVVRYARLVFLRAVTASLRISR